MKYAYGLKIPESVFVLCVTRPSGIFHRVGKFKAQGCVSTYNGRPQITEGTESPLNLIDYENPLFAELNTFFRVSDPLKMSPRFCGALCAAENATTMVLRGISCYCSRDIVNPPGMPTNPVFFDNGCYSSCCNATGFACGEMNHAIVYSITVPRAVSQES